MAASPAPVSEGTQVTSVKRQVGRVHKCLQELTVINFSLILSTLTVSLCDVLRNYLIIYYNFNYLP